MKKFSLLLYVSVTLIISCSKSNSAPPNNIGGDTTMNPPDTTLISNSTFAKDADIGWLTEMEVSGYKFYNRNGVEEDCHQV